LGSWLPSVLSVTRRATRASRDRQRRRGSRDVELAVHQHLGDGRRPCIASRSSLPFRAAGLRTTDDERLGGDLDRGDFALESVLSGAALIPFDAAVGGAPAGKAVANSAMRHSIWPRLCSTARVANSPSNAAGKPRRPSNIREPVYSNYFISSRVSESVARLNEKCCDRGTPSECPRRGMAHPDD